MQTLLQTEPFNDVFGTSLTAFSNFSRIFFCEMTYPQDIFEHGVDLVN